MLTQIVTALPAGALLLFDLGYTNFTVFTQLTAAQVTFVTRAKSNLVYEVVQWLTKTAQVRDALVWIGQGADRQQVRLIEVVYRNTW